MNRRSFFGTLLAAPVAVKAALTHKPTFGRWFRSWKPAPAILHGSERVLGVDEVRRMFHEGYVQLAVVMPGDVTATKQMADEIIRTLPDALARNDRGISEAIQQVIDDHYRTHRL